MESKRPLDLDRPLQKLDRSLIIVNGCSFLFCDKEQQLGCCEAPGFSSDLLHDNLVLMVDHCIFFQFNTRLKENVMVFF